MLIISGEENRYRNFERRNKLSALSFSFNFSKYRDKKNVLFVKILTLFLKKNTYMGQLLCCVNNKNKKWDKNWQLRSKSTGEPEVMREAKVKPLSIDTVHLLWELTSGVSQIMTPGLQNCFSYTAKRHGLLCPQCKCCWLFVLLDNIFKEIAI